jgi:hypothetical protein
VTVSTVVNQESLNYTKGLTMDNVTLIRVVSGILAVVVLVVLIYRMKKRVPR